MPERIAAIAPVAGRLWGCRATHARGARPRSLGYGPVADGVTVEFVTIANAGHVWPGGRDIIAGRSTYQLHATDEIWNFFERHPEP